MVHVHRCGDARDGEHSLDVPAQVRVIGDPAQVALEKGMIRRVEANERDEQVRDGAVTVPISGNFQASNGDALVTAALAGQGLIYEPTFLIGDEIRAGRLEAITLDQPPVELPGVFAVYAENRRPPAKVRAFIDFLTQRLGPAPPWDRDLNFRRP